MIDSKIDVYFFTDIFYRSSTLNQSSNEELLKNDAFRHTTEILEAVNAKESFSDLAILVTSLFNVFERYIIMKCSSFVKKLIVDKVIDLCISYSHII